MERSSSDIAVRAESLVKSYGTLKALDGISFDAERGETFGIIGPDGAGKSTLFRILTSLMLPGSGRACVDGLDTVRDYAKVRKIIGYMPGKFSLYQDLTVEENLRFFATLFGTSVRENYHLIKDIYCQIEPFKDRPAGKLSGGMKQKLALSCALIHSPRVLFLDEPTTGVDPVSRKEFWDMLGRLRDEGITILVSTPYMDEAGKCDRIALMRNGRFLSVATPGETVRAFRGNLFAVSSDRMHILLGDLRSLPGTVRAFSFGESVHLTAHQDITAGDIHSWLEGRGHTGISVRGITPSVEDCFITMLQDVENSQETVLK